MYLYGIGAAAGLLLIALGINRVYVVRHEAETTPRGLVEQNPLVTTLARDDKDERPATSRPLETTNAKQPH